METEYKNIHVIKVDMENRTPEDIARDAALQIAVLFDQLLESTNNEGTVEPKEYPVFQERGV